MSEERNDVRLEVRLKSAMEAVVLLKDRIANLAKEVESVGADDLASRLKEMARYADFVIVADDGLRRAGLRELEQ